MSDTLRYPIGRFSYNPSEADELRQSWIGDLARLPNDLDGVIEGLSAERLDTPYRPGGWTVRQLVHHIADSHINAYVRFRLALTEDNPTVKGYDENAWAELPDSLSAPITPSLEILRGLHSRWVTLLRSLEKEQFSRTLVHSEAGPGNIDKYIGLYAWHGRHHVAHIRALRDRENW